MIIIPQKGALEEWFSKILHGLEDHISYSILFREFNQYIEISFDDFYIRFKNEHIPLHRISQIRKDGIPVYTRPNFCIECGLPLSENVCYNINCIQYNK